MTTLTASDILRRAFVITAGGKRLSQFRESFQAVGLNPDLVREWRECRIENEGSMGNAISQYSLVRFALQSGLSFLVVFEDDAVPCDNAADELVKAFESRPDDCLCLSLGWSQTYPKQETEIARRSEFKRVYGSHAYALFGEKAYLEFMSKWERNGRADVVLGMMDGSYKGIDPIFAQHTTERSIHLPDGWAVDSRLESEADLDLRNRFSKVVDVVERRNEAETMHVAYAVDIQGAGATQFSDQLLVSIYSIKKNMDKFDRVSVHVFYHEIPANLMRRAMLLSSDRFSVSFSPIDKSLMEKFESCTKRDPKSNIRVFCGITFARFYLPVLMKEDRVLYMDADTMVRSSIRKLWETEFSEEELIGAVQGVVPEFGFNSGILLLDLKKLRNCVDEFFKYAGSEAHDFYLPDQTAMNRFFSGKIRKLDSSWMFAPAPGETKDEMWNARIWHFYNGPKPRRINSDDAGKALVLWNNDLAEADLEIENKSKP